MRKLATRRFAVFAGIAVALRFAVFSPTAYAGAPFSNPGASVNYHDPTHQDPHWLALKYAYCIRSGVYRGEPKGTHTHPYIVSSAFSTATTYSAYELNINDPVPTTWEPSSGCCSNFGSGTASYDDARHYYSAGAFFDLCGPGAADNALYYWPTPNNFLNNSNVYDN
jgi:hypothetical protein